MTIIEQRKNRRFPVLRQPAGDVLLRTGTAAYPVNVIKDISSSGIRVYLHYGLPVSSRLIVEYVEPNLKLEVNGTVAWCATRRISTVVADEAGSFVIGVELFSPVLLLAVMNQV
jgi:hypothetical protein